MPKSGLLFCGFLAAGVSSQILGADQKADDSVIDLDADPSFETPVDEAPLPSSMMQLQGQQVFEENASASTSATTEEASTTSAAEQGAPELRPIRRSLPVRPLFASEEKEEQDVTVTSSSSGRSTSSSSLRTSSAAATSGRKTSRSSRTSMKSKGGTRSSRTKTSRMLRTEQPDEEEQVDYAPFQHFLDQEDIGRRLDLESDKNFKNKQGSKQESRILQTVSTTASQVSKGFFFAGRLFVSALHQSHLVLHEKLHTARSHLLGEEGSAHMENLSSLVDSAVPVENKNYFNFSGDHKKDYDFLKWLYQMWVLVFITALMLTAVLKKVSSLCRRSSTSRKAVTSSATVVVLGKNSTRSTPSSTSTLVLGSEQVTEYDKRSRSRSCSTSSGRKESPATASTKTSKKIVAKKNSTSTKLSSSSLQQLSTFSTTSNGEIFLEDDRSTTCSSDNSLLLDHMSYTTSSSSNRGGSSLSQSGINYANSASGFHNFITRHLHNNGRRRNYDAADEDSCAFPDDLDSDNEEGRRGRNGGGGWSRSSWLPSFAARLLGGGNDASGTG